MPAKSSRRASTSSSPGVDAAEDDPGDRGASAGGVLVGADGVGELADGPRCRFRHEGAAAGVDGGGEGDDEAVRVALGGEAKDCGDEADGGDGDRFRGDAAAAGMREDLGGADDVGVVVERFALALENGAGDGARRFVAHGDELGDDLPAFEMAREAEAAGRAEIAGHRAAGLAGEADGEAAFFLERNAHRFSDRAVGKSEEVFHEAVGWIRGAFDDLGALAIDELRDRDFDAARDGARGRIAVASVGDGVGEDAAGFGVADCDVVRAEVRCEVFGEQAEDVRDARGSFCRRGRRRSAGIGCPLSVVGWLCSIVNRGQPTTDNGQLSFAHRAASRKASTSSSRVSNAVTRRTASGPKIVQS